MMELPVSTDSGGNDNTANNNEEQSEERLENAPTDTTAKSSVVTTEIPTRSGEGDGVKSTEVASASGKRDHSGRNVTESSAGMGIMGVHSAKRGKREWLSFRGSRQTRVGADYQVTSLPPLETNAETGNAPSNGKGK